jgi:hypothetical protein
MADFANGLGHSDVVTMEHSRSWNSRLPVPTIGALIQHMNHRPAMPLRLLPRHAYQLCTGGRVNGAPIASRTLVSLLMRQPSVPNQNKHAIFRAFKKCTHGTKVESRR